MSYNWINVPIIDALEYFTASFVSFAYYAQRIGSLFFLIGIVWNSLQLIFGTAQIRKVLVSNVLRLLFFILILNIYFPVVVGIRKFATTVGSSAGISADILSLKLSNYMKQVQKLADSEISAESRALKEAINVRDSLPTPQELMDKYNVAGDYMITRKNAVLQQALQDYNAANMRVEYYQNIVNEMFNKPKGNLKTFLALQSILKPNSTSETAPTGAENYTDYSTTYALDLTLRNSSGEDTGYLSPSSILRMSILLAGVLWEKEWLTITDVDNGKKKSSVLLKYVLMGDFNANMLFTLILTFICVLGIILSTIFFLMQYVMCILEYTIVTSMAIILLPFMLIDGLKSYAEKIMSAIFGLSIKLCVITLCVFFAAYALMGLTQNTLGASGGMGFETFAYCIFTIFLCFVLTQNAPQIAVTMLTGNPQLSMGELVHAMGTVTGAGHMLGKTAGTAGSALKTGGQFAMNRAGDIAAIGGAAKGAFNAASEGGVGGIGSTIAGAAAGVSTAFSRGGQHIGRNTANAVLGEGWNRQQSSGESSSLQPGTAGGATAAGGSKSSIDFAGVARDSKNASPGSYTKGQYSAAYNKGSSFGTALAKNPIASFAKGDKPPASSSSKYTGSEQNFPQKISRNNESTH